MIGSFVFTKKVLSWQRKLSPFESQSRLSGETLAVIAKQLSANTRDIVENKTKMIKTLGLDLLT